LKFNEYRQKYNNLTFKEKKRIHEGWEKVYPQTFFPSKSAFCKICINMILEEVVKEKLKILEVGTYDGKMALHILTVFPTFIWIGYDILNRPIESALVKYDFKRIILDKEIYETNLDKDYDIFYSGDTLEHFSSSEIIKIIDKTSFIPYQIHVVDFGRSGSDAHVMMFNPLTLDSVFLKYYDIILKAKDGARKFYFFKRNS